MDSQYKPYIERAANEMKLAEMIFKISLDDTLQISVFKIPNPETYFSGVISHSYYAIFYCAKAYLTKKGIKTEFPNEHMKTFDEFKKFIDDGILDVELLNIYEQLLLRAETLLSIFHEEKGKRTKYTYKKLPQANKEPAEESMKNSRVFFKHINKILEKEN